MWRRKHSRCGVSRKLLDSTLCCYQCHGTGSCRRPCPSCCWPICRIYWRSGTTRSAYDTRPYRQDFKEKTSLAYPYHITKANYNGQRGGRFQRQRCISFETLPCLLKGDPPQLTLAREMTTITSALEAAHAALLGMVVECLLHVRPKVDRIEIAK